MLELTPGKLVFYNLMNNEAVESTRDAKSLDRDEGEESPKWPTEFAPEIFLPSPDSPAATATTSRYAPRTNN